MSVHILPDVGHQLPPSVDGLLGRLGASIGLREQQGERGWRRLFLLHHFFPRHSPRGNVVEAQVDVDIISAIRHIAKAVLRGNDVATNHLLLRSGKYRGHRLHHSVLGGVKSASVLLVVHILSPYHLVAWLLKLELARQGDVREDQVVRVGVDALHLIV